MNSHAIRQNTVSWSGLFAEHLEVVKKRSSSALGSAGYDSLLVHAGTPPLLFLDDHHLPFRVQAPFKVWAPLTDAPDSFVFFTPGKKPQLLIHQPVDYWHKSPELPNTYWSDAFDIVSCADRAAARAALPKDLSRTAFIGAPFPELLGWGPAAINPEHLIAQLDYGRAAKTPYEVACLREANVLGARGHGAAETRVPRRRQRIRDRARVHGGLRPAGARVAVQPHHRAERRRRGTALPDPAARQAGEAALAAHRRRRRVRAVTPPTSRARIRITMPSSPRSSSASTSCN